MIIDAATMSRRATLPGSRDVRRLVQLHAGRALHRRRELRRVGRGCGRPRRTSPPRRRSPGTPAERDRRLHEPATAASSPPAALDGSRPPLRPARPRSAIGAPLPGVPNHPVVPEFTPGRRVPVRLHQRRGASTAGTSARRRGSGRRARSPAARSRAPSGTTRCPGASTGPRAWDDPWVSPRDALPRTHRPRRLPDLPRRQRVRLDRRRSRVLRGPRRLRRGRRQLHRHLHYLPGRARSLRDDHRPLDGRSQQPRRPGDRHEGRRGEGAQRARPGTIEREARGLAERLKTDRIDLYYAHLDDPGDAARAHARAFDALVGRARCAPRGVELLPERLDEALAAAPERPGRVVALQPHYNLVERELRARRCAPVAARGDRRAARTSRSPRGS